jgi:hypothetical protein
LMRLRFSVKLFLKSLALYACSMLRRVEVSLNRSFLKQERASCFEIVFFASSQRPKNSKSFCSVFEAFIIDQFTLCVKWWISLTDEIEGLWSDEIGLFDENRKRNVTSNFDVCI